MPNLAAMAPPATSSDDKQLCQCCKKHPPHSAAQARGESIGEKEFYAPERTGPRRMTGKGGVPVMAPRDLTKSELQTVEKARATLAKTRASKCKDQVPPDPPGDDPCFKYYRVDAGEAKEARQLFDDTKNINHEDYNPDHHAPGNIMIAHRVPISGGGCPVGKGNQTAVRDGECAKFDSEELGMVQGQVALIGR